MQTQAWYLIAYDIADPRRLRQVHQALRRDGVPMQQSVFLVQRDRRGIVKLMDEIARLMHRQEDDLRAYPIPAPGKIWLRGKGVLAGDLLAPGDEPRPQAETPPKRGWWRRLAGSAETTAAVADQPGRKSKNKRKNKRGKRPISTNPTPGDPR
jgi:CRISPR-associated protein Cas2